MSDDPMISVLIPTYNRAHMVVEAIQSVFNQTFQDFEIIVIDDGSTDNTKEVIKTLGDRVHYFYQENQGRPSARNYCLRQSRGKYITFLDSDDLYVPNKLEKQINYMLRHPECGMTYTSFERILVDGTHIDIQTAELGEMAYHTMLRELVIGTPTVMLRREVVDRIGEFDEFLKIMEDVDYWIRIARHYEIHSIGEVLVRVRIHNDENFVRDPEQNLIYHPYIIRKHLGDNNIIFRNRILAYIFFVNGLQLLNYKPEKLRKAWLIFIRGFIYWPFDRRMPIYLSRLTFRSLLPNTIKSRLRKFLRH